jgi:hypothetical protein
VRFSSAEKNRLPSLQLDVVQYEGAEHSNVPIVLFVQGKDEVLDVASVLLGAITRGQLRELVLDRFRISLHESRKEVPQLLSLLRSFGCKEANRNLFGNDCTKLWHIPEVCLDLLDGQESAQASEIR